MIVANTGQPIWQRTILGAPVTKKNHSRIISVRGKPRILPSLPYVRWINVCMPQIGAPLKIDYEVSCRALIYRQKRIGDACNFYQAIADMLEEYEIVTNDSKIVSWDGSRLLLDAQRPRLELSLFTVERES